MDTGAPAALEMIKHLRLEPLQGEGGWFRRVAEGPGLPGGRRAWSTILALFTAEHFSALHRLAVDEVWSLVAGDAFEMMLLTDGGEGQRRLLSAASPVVAVPAGTWQGGRPRRPDGWSVVSCTCVPGFVWEDLELAGGEALAAAFPAWAEAVYSLTRS